MQKENNLTVGQWSVHWFTTNRQKWNGNTEGGYRNLIYSHIIRYNAAKGYEGIIEHHIIPAIGAIKLKQLSSIHIQRMYNDLKENGRMPRGAKQNDKPLSSTFVRRVHAVLQAALKQAVKERHKRSDGNGYFGGACVPAFGRGNVRRGNCGCSGEREEKIVVVALVDTLKYLKRGGRISKTAAFAGGILNIKPVISVTDGEIHLLGKARGSKMGNNLLVQEIDKAGGIDFSKPVLLGYSGLSGALLLKYIEDSRHIWEGHLREVRYTTVGSVIGTHLGPGAVVVAFFKNQYNAEQNSSD